MVSQSPQKHSESSQPTVLFTDEKGNYSEEPLRERGSLKPDEILETIKEKLNTWFNPDQAEGSAKPWQNPIVMTVVGLHIVALFLPLAGGSPNKEEKKKPEQKEKPVAITQIATGMAKPKVPSNVSAVANLPKANLPKLSTPSSAPVINIPGTPKSAPTPATTQTSTSPAQSSSPSASSNSQQSPAGNLPGNLPNVTPAPPGASSGFGGDSIDPNNPFADFPHVGSQNADGNYEVASNTVSAVAAQFMQKLPGLKYTASQGSSDGSRSVIQFSKGGKTATLTMFQDGGNVLYAVAETEIASVDELKSSMPSIFDEMIAGLPTPPPQDGAPRDTPSETDFDEPSKFFARDDEFRSEIGINPRVIVQDPSSLYSEISGQLAQKFEISSKGSYGGGNLWELKKGKKSYYLNLVPQKGKNGTNLVIWTSLPS